MKGTLGAGGGKESEELVGDGIVHHRVALVVVAGDLEVHPTVSLRFSIPSLTIG